MHFFPDRGWVGWKKTPERESVEITFEFDKVREFHQLHIFTNNQFTRDVAMFKEARISFSIGGEIFNSEPELFEPMEDSIFEEPRNVSMKLHRRAAKFIKVQLFFASKWIMISEISFESNVARGNYSVEVKGDDEGERGSEENENVIDGSAINQINDVQQDQVQKKKSASASNATTSSSADDDLALMPIVIGVLMTVILILAGIILFIVHRNRRRKWRNYHHPMSDVNCTAAEKMALNNSAADQGSGYPFSTAFAGITMATSDTTGSSTGSGKSSNGTPLQQAFPKLDDNYNTPHHIMTPRSLRNNSNAANGPLPMYTCLLYTSPSPRDRQKSRMPSSA